MENGAFPYVTYVKQYFSREPNEKTGVSSNYQKYDRTIYILFSHLD